MTGLSDVEPALSIDQHVSGLRSELGYSIPAESIGIDSRSMQSSIDVPYPASDSKQTTPAKAPFIWPIYATGRSMMWFCNSTIISCRGQNPTQAIMPSSVVEPETFFVKPTPHVPNSHLPVVVYRGALDDTSPDNILKTIEPNGWLKGGQWKTFKTVHFHSNAHECYGIIKGSSTYRLGKSDLDADKDDNGVENGTTFFAQAGDVFVLPVRLVVPGAQGLRKSAIY